MRKLVEEGAQPNMRKSPKIDGIFKRIRSKRRSDMEVDVVSRCHRARPSRGIGKTLLSILLSTRLSNETGRVIQGKL